MDKKTLVIVISLVLVVVFLSTIGSFYTGYVVKEQNQITLEDYPYPFIKNNAPNGLFIVIPHESNYYEYNAATKIANSLRKEGVLAPTIVTDKKYTGGEHNLILIGRPCNNIEIAAELDTIKCHADLKHAQGYIKLINKERTSTLIVSGYNTQDIAKSAEALAHYTFYPLLGKEITITGRVGSLNLQYYEVE